MHVRRTLWYVIHHIPTWTRVLGTRHSIEHLCPTLPSPSIEATDKGHRHRPTAVGDAQESNQGSKQGSINRSDTRQRSSAIYPSHITFPISLAKVSESFVASDATYPILSGAAHCGKDKDARAHIAPSGNVHCTKIQASQASQASHVSQIAHVSQASEGGGMGQHRHR